MVAENLIWLPLTLATILGFVVLAPRMTTALTILFRPGIAREMLGLKGDNSAIARLRARDAPPALVTSRLKLWPRADVQAVSEGRHLLGRVQNALRFKYLDADEVAAIVGMNRTNVRRSPRVPAPVMSISGAPFWLRETFADQT